MWTKVYQKIPLGTIRRSLKYWSIIHLRTACWSKSNLHGLNVKIENRNNKKSWGWKMDKSNALSFITIQREKLCIWKREDVFSGIIQVIAWRKHLIWVKLLLLKKVADSVQYTEKLLHSFLNDWYWRTDRHKNCGCSMPGYCRKYVAWFCGEILHGR